MSQQELTPWFPASVKPTRPGVYLVGYRSVIKHRTVLYPFPYHYFDGKKWICEAALTPRAMRGKRVELSEMYSAKVKWRGLAHQPK